MNPGWFDAARIFVLFVLPCTIAAATLALFFRVLGRMKRLDARLASAEANLKAEYGALAKSFSSLEREVAATVEEQAQASIPSAGPNSAKRSKALKMHRLGQSIEQIASMLHLPKGDVALLLKVHGIVLRSLEPQENTLNESSE